VRWVQALHPVTSVQSEMSLWTRERMEEVRPCCQDQGIAFLPYSPLGQDFLTGRFTSCEDLPLENFRRRLPHFPQQALCENLTIAATVGGIAGRIGATPVQVGLAWLLVQGQYVAPIAGTKTLTYLTDNAGAADIELSPEHLAELNGMPALTGTRY
jgi:aryl-alcohol dehydrogenase-like predicted oxidoreductase